MKKILIFILLTTSCFGAYDKTKPSSSTSLRASNPEILANWDALEAAIDNQHAFTTGGTQDGEHTQGSAKGFSQSSAPATQVDGGAFVSADLGLLWIDTDDNALYVLTATTPTWTPVSDEVIAVAVAAIHTWAATQTFSVSPVFTKGIVPNDTYLLARNATGTGNLPMIKADSSNRIILNSAAGVLRMTTVNTLTNDLDIVHKKYVDEQFSPNPITGNSDSAGSLTLGNGFILKWGSDTVNTNATTNFAHGLTKCFNVQITMNYVTEADYFALQLKNIDDTNFQIFNSNTQNADFHWLAVGR